MAKNNEKRPEELAKKQDDFEGTELGDQDLEGASGGAAVTDRATEPEAPAGGKKAGKALKLRLQEQTKKNSMFFAG